MAKLADFLRTHQPNADGKTEETVYDLIRKNGVVYGRTDTHQDHIMAVLLRETGIGKPASADYPAPLKALVVTPTANDTYRLAFRRHGTAIFQTEAPGIEFVTTKRYKSLIHDQGGRVVVTNPEFLESAVLSGKMTNTKFDLVLTDNLDPNEASDTHTMIHSQQIGPVVIDFAIGNPHQVTAITENNAA